MLPDSLGKAGAWEKLVPQLSYVLDRNAIELVQQIAQKAAQPDKNLLATVIGVVILTLAGIFRPLSKRPRRVTVSDFS